MLRYGKESLQRSRLHEIRSTPERVAAILDILAKTYPGVVCALNHRNAWELTVATILSAQCTDVRVNLVTPALFKAIPYSEGDGSCFPSRDRGVDSHDWVLSQQGEVDQGAAQASWSEKFGGEVPRTMEEILQLPGVARKTGECRAGVVVRNCRGRRSGHPRDAHLAPAGAHQETTPEKIERDLMKIIPQDRWINFSHELIHHGRQVCIARKPRCVDCTLEKLCYSSDKTWSSHPV